MTHEERLKQLALIRDERPELEPLTSQDLEQLRAADRRSMAKRDFDCSVDEMIRRNTPELLDHLAEALPALWAKIPSTFQRIPGLTESEERLVVQLAHVGYAALQFKENADGEALVELWRLTTQGEEAIRDLSGPFRTEVIDFVLRRGKKFAHLPLPPKAEAVFAKDERPEKLNDTKDEGAPVEPADRALTITFEPDAITNSDRRAPLTGKGQAVLKAIAESRSKFKTRADLRAEIWSEDSLADDSVVNDAVSDARKALRIVLADEAFDPLPIANKGLPERGWRIELPAGWRFELPAN
jgi:hypothetical protein